jgi:protein phosphatase 1 regulatory subunit 10
MDPSLYNQWVQSQQLLPESPQHAQHVHHDGRPAPGLVDEWPKERPAPSAQSGGVGSPPPATPTLDMSDFTTLGDIGGKHTLPPCPVALCTSLYEIQVARLKLITHYAAPPTSAPSLSSPPQSFYAPFQHNNFFVASPYNTMAYGASWSPQPQVPLSNYSSLNGATTSSSGSSSSSSQQHQQRQQSPQPQQMMIEYVVAMHC